MTPPFHWAIFAFLLLSALSVHAENQTDTWSIDELVTREKDFNKSISMNEIGYNARSKLPSMSKALAQAYYYIGDELALIAFDEQRNGEEHPQNLKTQLCPPQAYGNLAQFIYTDLKRLREGPYSVDTDREIKAANKEIDTQYEMIEDFCSRKKNKTLGRVPNRNDAISSALDIRSVAFHTIQSLLKKPRSDHDFGVPWPKSYVTDPAPNFPKPNPNERGNSFR